MPMHNPLLTMAKAPLRISPPPSGAPTIRLGLAYYSNYRVPLPHRIVGISIPNLFILGLAHKMARGGARICLGKF